jgi:hypothetical protein
MRTTFLHQGLPALLVALAVALTGLALGAAVATPADGPQPILTADAGNVTGTSHGDSNSGTLGPYYSYSAACYLAYRLECRGYCTHIYAWNGCWYVSYWRCG